MFRSSSCQTTTAVWLHDLPSKGLGIKMGEPYFRVKHLVSQGRLKAYSSNYELYADLSGG